MSHAEKLYFSRPISNKAAGTGGDFNDNQVAAIQPAEDIKQFVDSATRPIRTRQSRSRPDMICLYQMGHFEHLLEKLGFVFYDNQQRRRDAHLAIETCIRPLFVEEKFSSEKANLEKLHALVEQRELTGFITSSASEIETQATTTHQNKRLELSRSRTVGNAVLVPDGISIVAAKASDVIAERIIRAADFMPGLGTKNLFSTKVEQEDGLSKEVETNYIDTLSSHIKRQLEDASDAKLIIFEMKNESDHDTEVKNWKAAYDAAKKVRQASGGKKSIMLIPSPEVFERNWEDGSTRNFDTEAVLQEIQNLLNQANQQQIKTPFKKNPYTCLDEQ